MGKTNFLEYAYLVNLLLGWLLLWRVAHLLRLRLTRLLHHLQERENVGDIVEKEQGHVNESHL